MRNGTSLMNSYVRPRNFLVARPTLRMSQIRLGDVRLPPQNFRWRSWQRLLISTSRHHRHNWGQFLSNCKTLRRFAPKCNDFLVPSFGVRVHLVLCFGARRWHKPSVRESVILGALSKLFWRVFVDFAEMSKFFPLAPTALAHGTMCLLFEGTHKTMLVRNYLGSYFGGIPSNFFVISMEVPWISLSQFR